MKSSNPYKNEYTKRRIAFSISCIAVIIIAALSMAGLSYLNVEITSNGAYFVTALIAVAIYYLKNKIWRCPACNHSFSMGSTSGTGIKSSNMDQCPKCNVSFK
jgi:hypothetical protein